MRQDLGKEKTSANIYEDAYIHKGRQKYIYKKNPPAINLDIGSLHIWKYKSLYICCAFICCRTSCAAVGLSDLRKFTFVAFFQKQGESKRKA